MMDRPLLSFILKRLAGLPVILLGISLLAFILIRFVPVEPAEVVLRMSNLTPTDEAIASVIGCGKLSGLILAIRSSVKHPFGTMLERNYQQQCCLPGQPSGCLC
jgi:ABC-type dipeptide/oligopeptide/nickel transport system permease component